MKGDFSRVTFRREKHYAGVELGQGRVISDATFNEEQAIRQYHEELSNRDVIGPSGAPREDDGFALSIVDSSLTIGGGRYYVDGILVENDDDELPYDDQVGSRPVIELMNTEEANIGLAYLEVWQRYITPLHDDHIREKALGGPDDSGRIQTWWRVNVLPLASVDVGEIRDTLDELLTARIEAEETRRRIRNAARRRALSAEIEALNEQISDLLADAGITCESEFRELAGLRELSTGRMIASTVPGAAEDGPCSLPAEGGFLGLENQLYRVEIYRSGTRSRARFIYSRENGSVIERISAFDGSDITLQSLGRDLNLGFADLSRYGFVELFNDETEARGESGELVRVLDVREDENVLELAAAPTISTDLDLNPKVRRWDQSLDQADGVGLMRLNQPDIELEHGIRVNFATGFFRQGDYWTFPARTAPIGDVEWVPAGQHPPDGVRHHFVPLAFVYNGPSTGTLSVLTDCRKIFPPLTAIAADDVSFDDRTCNLGADTVQEAIDALCRSQTGLCSITLGPDTDIAGALSAIPAGSDVYLCFQMGDYSVSQAINLANLGHVNVTGAGWGTRLRAPELERVFRFDDCTSVTIRDLHAESGTANVGDELGGTLEFRNCSAVTIEHTSLQCGHGTSRRTTCIKVLNTRTRVNLTHGTVRIKHNTLRVGHLQSGILLVNTSRIHVEDNQLMTYERPSSLGLRALAAARDLTYLTPISRALLTNIVDITIDGTASSETEAGTRPGLDAMNERLAIPGRTLVEASLRVPITDRHTIDIISPDRIIDGGDWETAINDENISVNEFELTTRSGVRGLLDKVGLNILQKEGGVGPAPSNWLAWFDRAATDDDSVMEQGIVIGGAIANDVHILNNTVHTCIQGIHVGLSRRNSAANLQSESVIIAQNTVAVSMPTAATGERHGIFVGNTESCLIENNYLTVDRFATTTNLSIEAIRVFGVWGARLFVRGNHVHNRGRDSFSDGVRMNPLNSATLRRWLVSDNIASVRVTGEFADLLTVQDNAD